MNSVIGALRVVLGVDTAAFQDGLKGAQSSLAKFGGIARAGAAALAGAVAAGGAALGAGVKSAVDAADEMSKAAAKIGVPIETLSRLKYAADLSDVSFEGLQTGLGILSRNMVKFGDGSTGAVKAFENLGVSATDAEGQIRPTEEVLADVADAFAAMPDGAEKTEAAMALFGKAGKDMIPLLNDGSAALREMLGEADRFGQVFSSEMGENAELFNDNISRLQGSFASVAGRLAEQLLPAMVQFSDFLVNNGPVIAEFIGFVAQIGVKIGELGVNFVGVLAKIGTALGDFARAIPETFAAIPDQMRQIGSDIISGLWEGLKADWESIKSSISGFARSIPNIFRSETQTQSPSRVMMAVGQDIMAGLDVGLQSMEGDISGGLQSFASGISQTFANILTEGGSFKESFQKLVSSSLGQFGGSLIQKGVGTLLGGFGIPGFANGTNFAPGGLAMVGERGPELVNLPRGSKVIPNNALRGRGGASSNTITFAPTINAPGADAQGLAQVRAQLAAMQAGFEERVMQAVNDPRARTAF